MKLIEENRLEKLIFAGLLGLTVLLPLVVWPGLVDRILFKDAVFFLGIGSLLMGSAAFGLKKGINIDRQTYLILGLLALVAASTWFSIHRETSIFGMHRLWQGAPAYLALAATYFVALQVKWDPARIRKLMIAAVSIAAGSSLFALVKFGLKISETGVIARADKASALFPGPNAFAFFLMAVFPLALRLALEAGRGKAQRALLGIGCIFIFAGNAIIFSRTGWIISIAVLVTVLLANKKRAAALAVVVGVVVVVLAAQGRDGSQADVKSYTSARLASIFQSSSLGPRLSMWQAAKDLTADRPLTGYGPDTFSLALVRHESMGLAAVRDKPRTPHNFFLNISSTLGLPALILILFIFLRSVKTALAGRDYLKQTLGLSMITMIILSQTLIWRSYMMLPLWLFMAVVSRDKFVVRGPKIAAMRLGAVVTALLIVGWTGALAVADYEYVRGASASDQAQARLHLNRAVAINPYAFAYWRALFGKSGTQTYQERLAIIARAKTHYPLSEEPLFMEALLGYKHGLEAGKTLDLLDRALKIRPYYVEARLLKGKILSERRQYDEAVRELDIVLKIQPAKYRYSNQARDGIAQISVLRSSQR